eukprot:363412-Chlamydomonas_euryale.AAC.5
MSASVSPKISMLSQTELDLAFVASCSPTRWCFTACRCSCSKSLHAIPRAPAAAHAVASVSTGTNETTDVHV